MAALGGILPLIQGVMSGFQQFQRAQNTSRQLEHQAAMQRSQAAFQQAQAQMFQQQAQLAIQEGEAGKAKRRRQALAGLGKTAAGFLGRGVSLAGSPLAVLGSEAAEHELEGQQILFEGRKTAVARENQASFARFRAAQDLQQASFLEDKASRTLSQAGTSLLGGAIGSFGRFAQSQPAPQPSFQQPRYLGIGRF